jgi:F-type H+-transporting ATPase subunit alpha
MAEYFMEKGKDVLIIYDDLSRHARAYRELSLLLRRPPAREAYPGDIFYIHSRLLERATHMIAEKGGGSITALPIIETEAQNIAAYIPTNLVSITDGQIYLSPKLFQEGIMPPVDVGKSVSRVGGQAQLPAYRAIAGDLKLSYSQFEELEVFERFSTRLDEPTQKTLNRGHKIREILKQPQYKPSSVIAQIVLLLCVTEGLLDNSAPGSLSAVKEAVEKYAETSLAGITAGIMAGGVLSPEDRKKILGEAVKLIPLEKKDGKNGVA